MAICFVTCITTNLGERSGKRISILTMAYSKFQSDP
jgi:hypothetical protein